MCLLATVHMNGYQLSALSVSRIILEVAITWVNCLLFQQEYILNCFSLRYAQNYLT